MEILFKNHEYRVSLQIMALREVIDQRIIKWAVLSLSPLSIFTEKTHPVSPKYIYRENTPSNKIRALTKNYPQIKFSEKVVSGKTLFFVIGPFILPIKFVLTLAFDRAVLYGKVALPAVVFSTKKRYSSFLQSTFAFQKTSCFKVLRTFEVSSDYHIKTCQSFKRRSTVKIHSIVFWRNIMSLCLSWNKITMRKCFLLLKQKPSLILL